VPLLFPFVSFSVSAELAHAAEDNIGAPGCTAIAEALRLFSALEVLMISSNYVVYMSSFVCNLTRCRQQHRRPRLRSDRKGVSAPLGPSSSGSFG
jgi:hypothetical protein